MLKRNWQVWMLLALLSLTVGAAYAKSSVAPNNKNYEFKQELEGDVGGKTLKPGVYNIVITYENAETGKVGIFKNKQMLVEAPCTIEKSDLKLESNGVAYGRTPEGKRFIRWLFLRERQEKIVVAPDKP